eukprot:358664-Chlamydomonas_euryale.AAC.6
MLKTRPAARSSETATSRIASVPRPSLVPPACLPSCNPPLPPIMQPPLPPIMQPHHATPSCNPTLDTALPHKKPAVCRHRRQQWRAAPQHHLSPTPPSPPPSPPPIEPPHLRHGIAE